MLSLISVAALAALGLGFGAQGAAAALPEVSGVELQPLAAQVKRVTEALDCLGARLSPAKQQALEAAMAMSDEAAATRSIQKILAPLCLVSLDIKADELADARAAYDHARATCRRLVAECQASVPTTAEAKPGQ